MLTSTSYVLVGMTVVLALQWWLRLLTQPPAVRSSHPMDTIVIVEQLTFVVVILEEEYVMRDFLDHVTIRELATAISETDNDLKKHTLAEISELSIRLRRIVWNRKPGGVLGDALKHLLDTVDITVARATATRVWEG